MKKTLPAARNLAVQIDRGSGGIHVFADALIVSGAADNLPDTISLETAVAINSNAKEGDLIRVEDLRTISAGLPPRRRSKS